MLAGQEAAPISGELEICDRKELSSAIMDILVK